MSICHDVWYKIFQLIVFDEENGRDYKSMCLISRQCAEVGAKFSKYARVHLANHLLTLIKLFPDKNWNWYTIIINPMINLPDLYIDPYEEVEVFFPLRAYDWILDRWEHDQSIVMSLFTPKQLNSLAIHMMDKTYLCKDAKRIEEVKFLWTFVVFPELRSQIVNVYKEAKLQHDADIINKKICYNIAMSEKILTAYYYSVNNAIIFKRRYFKHKILKSKKYKQAKNPNLTWEEVVNSEKNTQWLWHILSKNKFKYSKKYSKNIKENIKIN
jgi:hypothetical protein